MARAEAALGATKEPLEIVEKCSAHRQQRQGVDLCNDNVAKHLELEAATIKASIHFMTIWFQFS